ncbi:MAG TPA: hypothetical protein VFV33_27460, partial [Gemmatimonadaceae bacterium]|nr:hypothetical protein [Gemmatimonadaceae bacterium]
MIPAVHAPITARRAHWRRLAPAAVLLLAATPHLGWAQQRRVTTREQAREQARDQTREASPFEQEVERLVHDLLERKRTSMAIVGNVQELQLALRSREMAE